MTLEARLTLVIEETFNTFVNSPFATPGAYGKAMMTCTEMAYIEYSKLKHLYPGESVSPVGLVNTFSFIVKPQLLALLEQAHRERVIRLKNTGEI